MKKILFLFFLQVYIYVPDYVPESISHGYFYLSTLFPSPIFPLFQD